MINAYWESASIDWLVIKSSGVLDPCCNSCFTKGPTSVLYLSKYEFTELKDSTLSLKQIVKDRLAQSTPATASLTIANQFDIQSATATDDAGKSHYLQGLLHQSLYFL
jgi:hypothetical protein